MIKRDPVLPPDFLYPIEEWRWVERAFAPQFLPQAETIFAVANGYLGMRGAFEEGEPTYRHGTFVNGFHETWPIPYGRVSKTTPGWRADCRNGCLLPNERKKPTGGSC